jgi:cytochrome c556
MLVEHPTPEGYARIATAAKDLARAAAWLETDGPRHAGEHRGPEVAATVEQMAGMFRERAGQLERAAAEERWSGVTQALGALTSTCAGCHEAARWREGHAH